MSQRTSKTDLLVRVRYQNPLPPPPFPPRLLHVPTTPQRYATYEFLTPLQSERELPMILDGELGMPLEYGRFDENASCEGDYWMGNRDAIAPKGRTPPQLADEDLFLLEEPADRGAASTSTAAPGTPQRANVTDVSKKVDVSWLRRTEYLSSEAATKPLQVLNGTPKRQRRDSIDPDDRDGRAQAIAATFDAAHIPLAELRHPTKPNVTAVEAFEVLPDADLWANEYDLVRFGEDPADKNMSELPRLDADPRLPRAIFRDLTDTLGESRVSYYLPSDDATAVAYTQQRQSGQPTAEGQSYDYRWTRDYEIANNRALTKEYALTFDAGDEGEGSAATKGRKKGAYYVALSGVAQLRKRRLKKGEDIRMYPEGVDEQFWDGIAVEFHDAATLLSVEEQERAKGWKDEVEKPPADLVGAEGAEGAKDEA
ncbi:hypothetical protein JCM10207_008109 [Rhodosporidiobolus poonsookiae]